MGFASGNEIFDLRPTGSLTIAGEITCNSTSANSMTRSENDTTDKGHLVFKRGDGSGGGAEANAYFYTKGNGANGVEEFGLKNGANTVMLSADLSTGGIIMPNLPTSSAGLPSGALWNDAGTLKIV